MEKPKTINKRAKIKNKKRTRIITPKKKVGRTRISKGRSKDELEVAIEEISGVREVNNKLFAFNIDETSNTQIQKKRIRKKVRGKTKTRVEKKATSLIGEERGLTATTSKNNEKEIIDNANINAIILQHIKTIISTQSVILKKIADIEEDIKNMKLKSI
jgi:hypothetical protein